VLVTHGFLRSLARLELEESAVGRFAERPADELPPAARRAVTVGDTPWAVLAGGAAVLVLVWLALAARRR
jgi:hypothetical protein